MDFKELNEKLESFIKEIKKEKNEAEGFAVSGKKDEVNDIVQKLTQEYGDLTIPEFIDKLIQAEQKGEEILDENLNEGLDWDVIFDKHDKAMAMPINNINDVIDFLNLHFGKIDTKLHFLKQKNIEAKQNDDSSIIVYIDNTSYKVNFYIDSLLGTAAVKDYEQLAVNESFDENLLKDSTNCSRYYYWPTDCVPGYVHGTLSNKLGEMLNKANNKMFEFTYPLDNEDNGYWRSVLTIKLSGKREQGRLHVLVETKSPTTQKFTATWDLRENFKDDIGFGKFFKQIINPRGRGEYGFILGSTLARYTEEGYLEALQDLVEQIISKLTELDNSIKQEYNNADSELEELERVRAQAKANKIVASTTVKKALSKSAIAKKIQALQNPTPEQLARILAAIEG